MGASILSVATAVPEHRVTAEMVKEYYPKAFDLDARRLAVMNAVVDHSQVQQRYMVFPPEYTIAPRPLEKTTCEYKTHSIALSERAASEALAKAGVSAKEIDAIITVSCTGVMIPSVDAYLMNRMGFRADVRRLPVTELGCAAGAAALAMAADHIRAYPNHNVLVIAVELPSLTFQRADTSPAHLISCALFGDGAAAAVLSGKPSRGLRVLASQSFLIPESLDAMGFDLRSAGFHIVLSKNVPDLVRNIIAGVAEDFLQRQSKTRDDLRFFLIHPGGQKLLSYVESELGLSRTETELSWKVLAEYGNLSSATVLFITKEFLDHAEPAPGDLGLLAAFGPGFSVEMSLVEWNG